MLRKFGHSLKNVPRVTVTANGKWEPFLDFGQLNIFLCLIVDLFHGETARIRMFHYMLLFLRETNKQTNKQTNKKTKKKILKPHQNILLT